MTAAAARAMLPDMTAARKLDPAEDPMLARLLAAPLADELETDEEREAFDAIETDIRVGRHGASTEEVLAALKARRDAGE